MDQQKKKQLIVTIAAIVAFVLGIVLFVIAVAVDMNTVAKVLLILISVLALALAVELFFLYRFMQDSCPNYFLFDGKANRNVPLQKLTFQMINARMNRYLAAFAPSEGRIWTDNVLDNPNLQMAEAYRPLVSYKLLYDLAELDVDNGWKCFENASEGTIEFMAASIEKIGDSAMAKNLRQFKQSKPINLKAVRDYLVSNRKYLQSRIYRYVVDHIGQFNM